MTVELPAQCPHCSAWVAITPAVDPGDGVINVTDSMNIAVTCSACGEGFTLETGPGTLTKAGFTQADGTPLPGPPPPSQNAPCPCGSGKKYKLCHGEKRGR